jgi:hypothetical protein
MVDMQSEIIEDENGTKFWRMNKKIHRIDGPAIVWYDGHKEWWWYGRQFTFEKWLDLNDELTEEEKVMLKLQYG